MTVIAVIAKRDRSLGGGLGGLRRRLAAAGYPDPLWFEIDKSRQASKRAREALRRGADIVVVWGGDGTVQRCVDVLAGSGAKLVILPAGTANLLATNLGVPRDLDKALAAGLGTRERKIDVGVMNGEHFATMAGVGFDARMMRSVRGAAKRRLGRLAYIRAGVRTVRAERFKARVTVDNTTWITGSVSGVLLGNVGTVIGGLKIFEDASPDDGLLEVGVVTASGFWQWLRLLLRIASRRVAASPFVSVTQGREIEIRVDRPTPYELDGGPRKNKKRFNVHIEPAAISVGVPGTPAR